MMQSNQNEAEKRLAPFAVFALIASLVMINVTGQVRKGCRGGGGISRGTVVRGEEDRGEAVGRRGAVVKEDEGYAAVVGNEAGYQAAGRRGIAVKSEEGFYALGRRGTMVTGEEGYTAVGRHRVIVGNRNEDFEAWKAVASVGSTIAIGTLLSRPPSSSTTVVVGGTTYWYYDNAYYSRVYSGGGAAYQVVPLPAGAIIPVLPRNCVSARVGNVSYQNCGGTYYQPILNSYQVVVIR